ncbi:MAG: hypothetical protein IPG06_02405 [Haliea sp.]|nr:hypothetical protein [Haliea sp.]
MKKTSNRAILITTAMALGGLAATTVSAAPPAGQLLASQCAQCHGTNGGGPGFDSIAGKSADDLYGDLIDMKYTTQIESIMDRQARGYTMPSSMSCPVTLQHCPRPSPGTTDRPRCLQQLPLT